MVLRQILPENVGVLVQLEDAQVLENSENLSVRENARSPYEILVMGTAISRFEGEIIGPSDPMSGW